MGHSPKGTKHFLFPTLESSVRMPVLHSLISAKAKKAGAHSPERPQLTPGGLRLRAFASITSLAWN